MENTIPTISQVQKKQKGKVFSKPGQNSQAKPQAAAVASAQVQGQPTQQVKSPVA